MSIKSVYTCDICMATTNLDKLYGVFFNGYGELGLDVASDTNPPHICKKCATQIYKEVKRDREGN